MSLQSFPRRFVILPVFLNNCQLKPEIVRRNRYAHTAAVRVYYPVARSRISGQQPHIKSDRFLCRMYLLLRIGSAASRVPEQLRRAVE